MLNFQQLILTKTNSMKRNFLAATAIVLLAASLLSCKKETATAVAENNDLSSSVQNAATVQSQDVQKSIISKAQINPMGTNNWVIGSFKMKGKNLTSLYRGYYFQFESGNVLIATTPNDRIFGNWDMPGTETLTINFGKGPLSDLDENWTI